MSKYLPKIFAIVLLFISHTAFAAESTVETYVRKVMNESLNILNDQSLAQNVKTQKVRETLAMHLDASWMAKYTLGRYIRDISDEDVANFTAIYTKYVVSSYANAVSKYKGENVQIQSVSTLDDGFFKVRTMVIKTDSNVINVDYLVHKIGEKYKVCDVITEGISLIASQRSEYGNILMQSSITELMSNLKKHTILK